MYITTIINMAIALCIFLLIVCMLECDFFNNIIMYVIW